MRCIALHLYLSYSKTPQFVMLVPPHVPVTSKFGFCAGEETMPHAWIRAKPISNAFAGVLIIMVPRNCAKEAASARQREARRTKLPPTAIGWQTREGKAVGRSIRRGGPGFLETKRARPAIADRARSNKAANW